MHWVALGVLNNHWLSTHWAHSSLGRDWTAARGGGCWGILGLGWGRRLRHLNCTEGNILLGGGGVGLQYLSPCRLNHHRGCLKSGRGRKVTRHAGFHDYCLWGSDDWGPRGDRGRGLITVNSYTGSRAGRPWADLIHRGYPPSSGSEGWGIVWPLVRLWGRLAILGLKTGFSFDWFRIWVNHWKGYKIQILSWNNSSFKTFI